MEKLLIKEKIKNGKLKNKWRLRSYWKNRGGGGVKVYLHNIYLEFEDDNNGRQFFVSFPFLSNQKDEFTVEEFAEKLSGYKNPTHFAGSGYALVYDHYSALYGFRFCGDHMEVDFLYDNAVETRWYNIHNARNFDDSVSVIDG